MWRYYAAFALIVALTFFYLAWAVGQIGQHWAHTYWFLLAGFGYWTTFRFERMLRHTKNKMYSKFLKGYYTDD